MPSRKTSQYGRVWNHCGALSVNRHLGLEIQFQLLNTPIYSLKRHIRTIHEVEGYMDDNQNMSDVDCDVIDEGHDQITITNHDHPITMQSHQQDIIYYHNKQSNRKHAPGNRVACPECQKPIHPSSLSRHLADIHNKGTKCLF